ncbi:CRISPR-associated protein Csx16 [Anaeromassilibacillus senegalensis]|uniref:CRISPR-associated protein Csx16 n=1 Tax=Anaeromassilibacillus senegalensis TaxID=1673717 RepID=UPI000680903A|nr:CRISPR-associated protein Csx16 [Anaeromassilibacillus senegalensis]
MKKLNEIAKTNHIVAYGFGAIVSFAALSNPGGPEIVVSTLSPSAMINMGVSDYYAPVFPRGAQYTTAADIANADLAVNHVSASRVPDATVNLIVSRHPGTIKVLRDCYPSASVLTGNVSPEDIRGRVVVGTLPPHLVAECRAYIAVTIDSFDHTKDGDLDGGELRRRMRIYDPVAVSID